MSINARKSDIVKITFLGTGTSQGVPVIACPCDTCQSKDPRDKRLRTSAMIEMDGQVIVIDTGPDFRQQMLREEVKKLDAVVFTHEHKDHIGGLDDVRAFNFIQQRAMHIYCTDRVRKGLENDFHYAFAKNKYPGVPELKLHRIENKPFSINGIEFIPVEGLHYKLPVFGYRVGDFTYITDMNFISEEEQQKIMGSKVIAISALRHLEHISHFNLKQSLELIEKWKPEKAYLIHASHQLGKYVDVQPTLPDNVELSYDGLSFEIN